MSDDPLILGYKGFLASLALRELFRAFRLCQMHYETWSAVKDFQRHHAWQDQWNSSTLQHPQLGKAMFGETGESDSPRVVGPALVQRVPSSPNGCPNRGPSPEPASWTLLPQNVKFHGGALLAVITSRGTSCGTRTDGLRNDGPFQLFIFSAAGKWSLSGAWRYLKSWS